MRKTLERPVVHCGESYRARDRRRCLSDLLGALDQQARSSKHLVPIRGAWFRKGDDSYELAHYLFISPEHGNGPVRVGLFASLRGDEPEGAYALVELARLLEREPHLASGYLLSIYPVCNPTGFEDNTGHSRCGRDLTREFWARSEVPEVRLLEAELATHAFSMIISLHTDPQAERFYGIVRGASLAGQLLRPAVVAAETFLPSTGDSASEGSGHGPGLLGGWPRAGLRAPPQAQPRPFEISLVTPKTPPFHLKTQALIAAVRAILAGYRTYVSYAREVYDPLAIER